VNQPDPATIGLRVHAAPPGWQPTPKRRSRAPWPQTALLLLTVPRACQGEPLRYGACALLPSTGVGTRPACLQLFYPDDASTEDRETLARVARRHRLPAPLSRREFLKLLFKRCYKQRAALVGFGLPAQLARLAVGWGVTGDGGFRLISWTKPCPAGRRPKQERRRRPKLRNGEIEDGDRPAIAITPLDGLRAFIRFQGRGRPDQADLVSEGGGRPDPRYV
jgi:hypothetical protein